MPDDLGQPQEPEDMEAKHLRAEALITTVAYERPDMDVKTKGYFPPSVCEDSSHRRPPGILLVE